MRNDSPVARFLWRHRALILGVAAASLHGSAYLIYNNQVSEGTSDPNVVSWFIWAMMAILNLTSFQKMTSWVKSLQFWIGTAGATGTFLFGWNQGVFEVPELWELGIVALGIASAFAQFKKRHAPIGNLLIVIAAAIGMVPTLIGVIDDPAKETFLPWIVWTFAFICTFLNVVLMTPEEEAEQAEKLKGFAWVPKFSTLTLLLLHAIIVPLSLR